jgi:hypothetical protein
VRFGTADVEWDVESLLDLRRVDAPSWTRFVRLFNRFAELPPDAHPACATRARILVREYHERLAAARADWLVQAPAAWAERHPQWMALLDEVLGERGATADDVTAVASISLLSGRCLTRRLFGIPFYIALPRQIAICAHEALHFRYFEWLSRHHPDIARAQWDAPHHAWVVSELVAAVVARDPVAEQLFGAGPRSCYACPLEAFDAALDAWIAHRQRGGPFDDFYRAAVALVLDPSIRPSEPSCDISGAEAGSSPRGLAHEVHR